MGRVLGEELIVRVIERQRKVAADVFISDNTAFELEDESFTRHAFALEWKLNSLSVLQFYQLGDPFLHSVNESDRERITEELTVARLDCGNDGENEIEQNHHGQQKNTDECENADRGEDRVNAH
jgi:hypothetical protein